MENSIIKEVRRAVKNWWLLVITGLLLIGLGVWILMTPLTAYASLAVLFSIGLTVAGLVEVAFAVSNRDAIDGWGWALVGGIIDLALGIYLLSNPAVTLVTLPILLGIWLLFRGFSAIGTSIALRGYGVTNWGWLLALGLGIIVFAIVIMNNPELGALNIVIWTGVGFILAGIFRIMVGLRLHRLKERLDEHNELI
jgi:uncharacterized membrane protein HdeD (DUF308 family)